MDASLAETQVEARLCILRSLFKSLLRFKERIEIPLPGGGHAAAERGRRARPHPSARGKEADTVRPAPLPPAHEWRLGWFTRTGVGGATLAPPTRPHRSLGSLGGEPGGIEPGVEWRHTAWSGLEQRARS